MLTEEQAMENAFRSHLAHVRFWEARDGWPQFSEERIRKEWEALCLRAGERKEESRKRAVGADLGLPYLALEAIPQPPPAPLPSGGRFKSALPNPRPTTHPKPPRRVV